MKINCLTHQSVWLKYADIHQYDDIICNMWVRNRKKSLLLILLSIHNQMSLKERERETKAVKLKKIKKNSLNM